MPAIRPLQSLLHPDLVFQISNQIINYVFSNTLIPQFLDKACHIIKENEMQYPLQQWSTNSFRDRPETGFGFAAKKL